MSQETSQPTTQELTFIPAAAKDLPLVTRMMQAYYALDGLEYTPEVERAVADLIGLPEHGQVWLVEHRGQPIGYAVATFWYSLEFRGKAAFLDEIYLEPDFRNRGFGPQVIDKVAEFCRELGVVSLRLEVEHENTRAFKVYQRNGFIAHPRHLMTKWL